MKFLRSLITVFLVSLVTLSSCSDDNDSSKKSNMSFNQAASFLESLGDINTLITHYDDMEGYDEVYQWGHITFIKENDSSISMYFTYYDTGSNQVESYILYAFDESQVTANSTTVIFSCDKSVMENEEYDIYEGYITSKDDFKITNYYGWSNYKLYYAILTPQENNPFY